GRTSPPPLREGIVLTRRGGVGGSGQLPPFSLPDAKVSRGLVRRTPGSVAAHGRYPAHHRVRSGGRGSSSPACASVDHTRLRCCRWPLIGPPGFAVECRGTFRRPRHAEFHWRSSLRASVPARGRSCACVFNA